MVVHRLSSQLLENAEGFQKIARILSKESELRRLAVVLSPVHGIDSLIRTLIAEAVHRDVRDRVRELIEIHLDVMEDLHLNTASLRQSLNELAAQINDLFLGISLTRYCTDRTAELLLDLAIQAAGLILKELLIEHGVSSVSLTDRSLSLIYAKPSRPFPIVDWELTGKAIREWAAEQQGIVLLGGLLVATPSGQKVNFGRNSGDYIASLIASVLRAPSLTVWMNQDGLPVAPAAYIGNPKRIRQMSYEECMEMAYFGSDFLHPYTLLPLIEPNIPLHIRSIETPDTTATLIESQGSRYLHNITGLTSIEKISILNIEGGGMIGIPGFAARLFAALSQSQINVIMISQASSEHSICLAIREEETGRAVQAIERELEQERQSGQIGPIDILQPCSIVAIIGDGMKGMKGLSGRIFGALGRAGVNVLAIAQGSSERNISFAIAARETVLAIESLYHEFFGDPE